MTETPDEFEELDEPVPEVLDLEDDEPADDKDHEPMSYDEAVAGYDADLDNQMDDTTGVEKDDDE